MRRIGGNDLTIGRGTWHTKGGDDADAVFGGGVDRRIRACEGEAAGAGPGRVDDEGVVEAAAVDGERAIDRVERLAVGERQCLAIAERICTRFAAAVDGAECQRRIGGTCDVYREGVAWGRGGGVRAEEDWTGGAGRDVER